MSNYKGSRARKSVLLELLLICLLVLLIVLRPTAGIIMASAFALLVLCRFVDSIRKLIIAGARRSNKKSNDRHDANSTSARSTSEPEPEASKPQNKAYSCAEERSINDAYSCYLNARKNIILPTERRIKEIRAEAKQKKAQGMTEEAAALIAEIFSHEQALQQMRSSSKLCFDCTYTATLMQYDDVNSAYSKLIMHLNSDNVRQFGFFFSAPNLCVKSTQQGGAMIFTPCYVLAYSSKASIPFSVVTYGKLRCNGKTVEYDACTCDISMDSSFCQSFFEYTTLLEQKYSDAVDAILSHVGNTQKKVAIQPSVQEKRKDNRIITPTAATQTKKAGDFVIDNDTVTEWHGKSTNVTIPTGIATVVGTAFWWNTQVTSVAIGQGYSEIQEMAFFGASKLRSVTTPVGMKKIGAKAFCDCTELSEIHISDGVISIGDEAFKNCCSLRRIVIPDSVTRFGNDVFSGCTSLEQVTFGKGLREIGSNLFADNTSLTRVTLPSTATEIGDCAFFGCTSLSAVLFSGGLCGIEHIGKKAFFGCNALANAPISIRTKHIDDSAFMSCTKLRAVAMDKSVYLGKHAFMDCTALSEVSGIANSAWHETGAFCNTPWLRTQADASGFCVSDGYVEVYSGNSPTVTLPDDVRCIGEMAFMGNKYIEEVILPDGVLSIMPQAFADCERLAYITIPESVTQIADNAFLGSNAVTIRCFRGSFASAFRQEHGINGEYILKSQSRPQRDAEDKYDIADILQSTATLSNDEVALADYFVVQYDSEHTKLSLADDKRTITSNTFGLNFMQSEAVSDFKAACTYEAFFVDEGNHVVSDVVQIAADAKSNDCMTRNAVFTLKSGFTFDKSKQYHLILRYLGKENEAVEKLSFSINIVFATDFDF